MSTVTDPPRDQVSILGRTLRFKGELRAEEDVLIKGHVEGSILNSQRLTICREGHVKAGIQGQIIAVEGTVDGDMTATVSVAVVAGSAVTGDIHAPSISIVEGANFNGNVFMDTSKLARTGRPQAGRPAPTTASPTTQETSERDL